MYTLLQILSLMVLGFFLARYWSKEFFQQLSRLMVRVAMPLYFFLNISQTSLADIQESLLFPVAALCITLCGFFCAYAVFQFLPGSSAMKRVGIALASFGNSGMIPLTLIELFPLTIPVIGERFGTAAPLLYVGTYLLMYSPALWSFGNFLITGKGRRPHLRELITPPFLGIAAGLCVVIFRLQPILFNQQWPVYYVLKSLERFGGVTFILILVCLGSMIARIHLKEVDKKLLFSYALAVSAIRFLFMPGMFFLVYFLILRHLPLSPAQYWVIFLETHVPPATNLSIMAAQVGVNEDQISFITMIVYMLYMVVLPVYLLYFLALMGVS